MGNLRSLKRNLNEKYVWIAQEVQRKKIELAKKFVEDRVKTDAKFAKDVLAAVGENLPAEIKKSAEETIAREAAVTSEKVVSETNDCALDDPPVWEVK